MTDIEVTRTDGIVTVTLNRPAKKNAVTTAMWLELLGILQEVNRAAEDRVLILTGAGGEFCSGGDISEKGPGLGSLEQVRLVGEVAVALNKLSKPAIAKVDGVATGAGCNLALGCDLIVASERARFSEIFLRRGLVLDCGGSWLLPRLVGLHKAKELAFFADILSAAEAAEIGIVNRVVPVAELDGFVDMWARRLAGQAAQAMSLTKALLNKGLEVSLDQAVEDEARSQALSSRRRESAQAVGSFLKPETT